MCQTTLNLEVIAKKKNKSTLVFTTAYIVAILNQTNLIYGNNTSAESTLKHMFALVKSLVHTLESKMCGVL